MKKIFFSFFFIGVVQFVFAQADIRKLYERRQFEDCVSKCEKQLAKDPSNMQLLFLQALCYFEMAQTPDKYKEIVEEPLQESLKVLAKIKAKDSQNKFLRTRGDTLVMIKEFAEETARGLTEVSKTKAVRLYRFLYKAFEGDFNTLQLVEIYFKTEDYEKGIMEIDKMFSYNSATLDAEKSDTYEAMCKAPAFLVRYGMFENAYQLSEKYAVKYKDNARIYTALRKSMTLLLDTLFTSPDKLMFFEYSRNIKKLYQFDNEIQQYVYNKYMDLLKTSISKFEAIQNPQTWKDTIPLREFYKYSDMCLSVMQSNEFVDFEQKQTDKHHLEVPFVKQKLFAKTAYSVINQYRMNGAHCNMAFANAVDSLQWHDELSRVATTFAKDMYGYNYATHTDRKNRDVKGRVDDSDLKGYKINTFSGVQFMGALKLGEAIFTGLSWNEVKTDTDMQLVIEQLFKKVEKSKDGYCETMMDVDFTHFGLGVFGDRWVLILAQIKIVQD